MAGLEQNANQSAGTEGANVKFVPKNEDEAASLHLRMEACALTNREMTKPERLNWAEEFAADFAKVSAKDRNFTGPVGKDLANYGAKIEVLPLGPKSNIKGIDPATGFNKVKINFPEACKGDPLSNLQVELTPVDNGMEVSFKSLVKNTEKNAKLEENKITVNVTGGAARSTSEESADGSVRNRYLAADGKLNSMSVTNTDGTRTHTQFDGKHERGKEMPLQETVYNQDGTKQIKIFDKGIPVEKLTVSGERLVSYNAYDDKGNELSALNPKSLSGRAYYEMREIGSSAIQQMNLAQLQFDVWMRNRRLGN